MLQNNQSKVFILNIHQSYSSEDLHVARWIITRGTAHTDPNRMQDCTLERNFAVIDRWKYQ